MVLTSRPLLQFMPNRPSFNLLPLNTGTCWRRYSRRASRSADDMDGPLRPHLLPLERDVTEREDHDRAGDHEGELRPDHQQALAEAQRRARDHAMRQAWVELNLHDLLVVELVGA